MTDVVPLPPPKRPESRQVAVEIAMPRRPDSSRRGKRRSPSRQQKDWGDTTGEGEMCQVYILNRHGRHGLSQLLLLFSLLNGSKWSFHWKTMDRTWWIQCMAAMTLHQWRVRWFRARASSETMPQTRATWKAILYVTAWMWNKCRQHPLPWDQSRIPAAKPRVFAP